MIHYLAFVFPFLFIGMWILVTFIISKKGWADLVAKYQSDGIFNGERVGIISALVNGTKYKNALILKYNATGIFLKPILPFRLFHKPVLIPWNEIRGIRDKKVLFSSFKELIIGQPFVAILHIGNKNFQKIETGLKRYSTNL